MTSEAAAPLPRRARRLLGPDDARRAARRRLPGSVFRYFEGGSEERLTIEANREAFRSLAFRPHVGVAPTGVDASVDVLGTRLAMPVVLAPAGYIRLAHRDGELGAARAAQRAGIATAVSSLSSQPIEAIADAAGGDLAWYQVYFAGGRAVVERAIERARVAGCGGLVVTIDMAALGSPERPLRGGKVPTKIDLATALRHGPGMLVKPAWLAGFVRDGLSLDVPNLVDGSGRVLSVGEAAASIAQEPPPTWEDLEWIRAAWPGPLIVKGILRADDARRAVDVGADGVVVSNHGGNVLDGSVATLRALPEVVDAVGDRVEVLLDGGVRRGVDVVKAVALGARAVLIGRPYIWALAAAGEAGVDQTLRLFQQGVERTLALLGCRSVEDLEPSLVTGAWRDGQAPGYGTSTG